MSFVAQRLQEFGESVFTTMSRLAVEHGAINLSQGFPDFDGPVWLKKAALRAIESGPNQYAPAPGLPKLRQGLAEKMKRESGLSYDPDREVTVVSGATEAIAAVLLGLLNPQDEVILFEPFYDSYPACVRLAGATPRFCTLVRPHFGVNWEELESLITPRTRAILINTPGNPHGAVMSLADLENFRQLGQRHPHLLFITDEVYEHIVFPPHRHHHLAALEGMQERTLVISSFSKTLSMTGWKVGYVFAPAALTAAVRASHQFLTFCSASPLQHAIAESMPLIPDYLEEFGREYRTRRDLWCEQLQAAGLSFQVPQGSYFIMSEVDRDDVEFCHYITREVGVAAIPASAFYHHKERGKGLVRWAFCKSPETLKEAGQRLRKLSV
jgi:N-succinyldiaminopimelate aminotransferase